VIVSLAPASLRARAEHWLNDRPDESVLRWLFRTLLAVSAAVLVLDFVDLNSRVPEPVVAAPGSAPALAPGDGPDLTRTAAPRAPARRDGDRRAPLRRPDPQLAAAMTFDLQGDGRLLATGTIQPGTAKTFAAEVEKRGSYVKTVVLHSPGGSVADALDMGRLIRKQGFATEVADGAYCASSCPLVFAGGAERRAGSKAAIGVHQVTAVGRDGIAPANGMESVQRVSAECQRYLRDMGIDGLVWIHAMETPADELFYFKPDELLSLKLATPRPGATPAAASADPRAKS
jgi:hypothetical protein